MNTSNYPDGVLILDTHHMGRTRVVATYALLGDEPALVDPGPAGTLPAVEADLAQHDLTLADIRHILLTHIHLDHAGATGLILERNPAIQVHVHQQGAAHLIDPSRLVNSATQLWGDQLETLWGRTIPVPAGAILTLQGGETLRIGGRSLRAYDAPGHAKHHLIWLDEQSGAAFVGDTLGVRLPLLKLTRPATPPPDVDLEAWVHSVDLIGSLHPNWLMLTHFGAYDDVQFHLEDFRERLLNWSQIVRTGMLSGTDQASQMVALAAQASAELAALSEEERVTIDQQSGGTDLSWLGLVRYWQKRGVIQRAGSAPDA